ncbi:MAG: PrsW family intramembrane metalloprotease [Myxococcales bacterium]|nr:PrsW family intramembrane metalloprotease [Myxococcales bacterium]
MTQPRPGPSRLLVDPCRIWAALALLALGSGLAGCSPRLAGTNDAALEYELEPTSEAAADPASEPAGATSAALAVKARLVSARIPAEVTATAEGRVRVVVDADVGGAVDDLLLWRGGVTAYLADGTFPLEPPNPQRLRPMAAATGAGTADRFWQGPGDAVAQAVRETELDERHAVFAERLPGGDWRTRVVSTPPIATFETAPTSAGDGPGGGHNAASIRALGLEDRGRAIGLRLTAAALAPIVDLRRRDPAACVVLARGSTLLATLSTDEATADPVVIPFGRDLPAYARAQRNEELLASPSLPSMHRASVTRLPPRPGLATACAVLPFFLSLAWLTFVRRFDRARPEPLWLVVATFGLGALSVFPAALVENALGALTPWLDPALVTLGGQARALPLAILVFALTPGAVEEGAKWLAAWSLARQRREFDEPIDGIVYACAAALGFAAMENVKYFASGRMSGAVIAARAFMTVPAHLFFASLWGYAMGRQLVSRRARVLPWFALAALAHAVFDASLAIDGAGPAATVLVLVLAVVFVGLLRRALRHGAVAERLRPSDERAPETEPAPPSTLDRALYRVGALIPFYGGAAGMVVCAGALTVLGAAYEVLQHRVGVVFVSLATAMLVLFGFAAYIVSETIPLDVVLDARGLTFAGALTRWRSIVRVDAERESRRRWFVRVGGLEGELRVGPMRAERATELSRAIAAAAGLVTVGQRDASAGAPPSGSGPG